MKYITTLLLSCLLLTACSKSNDDLIQQSDFAKQILGTWKHDSTRKKGLEITTKLIAEYKVNGNSSANGTFSIKADDISISGTADYADTSTWRIEGDVFYVKTLTMGLANPKGNPASKEMLNKFNDRMQGLITGKESKLIIKTLSENKLVFIDEHGNESELTRQ